MLFDVINEEIHWVAHLGQQTFPFLAPFGFYLFLGAG
jgi:hypothetical protein